MKISVIVTNFNGHNLLKKNLPTVIENSPESLEIIIADDASTDNSLGYVKSLQKEFTKLKIISHKKNVGFGANTNLAVKKSKGDLVVLLNSDIKPAPNYIKNTLQHFKDPNVFGVGFAEKGHENWGDIYWQNGFLQHRPGLPANKHHLTDWLSGGSCIIRKNIFIKLGGFDPIYAPFYFEDLDLGIRADRSGFKMIWEPTAVVEHRHEQTMSKQPKHLLNYVKERNHLIVTRRFLPPEMKFIHRLTLIGRVISGPNYLKIIRAAKNQINKYPQPIILKNNK
jgi:GT2 family glycosyltransferase